MNINQTFSFADLGKKLRRPSSIFADARSFGCPMAYEKPDGIDWLSKDDVMGFLTKKRPDHPLDKFIMAPPEPRHSHFAGGSGFVDFPDHSALHPIEQFGHGDGQPGEWGDMYGAWSAEHLMEEYMKTQEGKTPDPVEAVEQTEAEVADVLQLEDERVHQLINTPDPVQRAVVLLRLLEEDVYMMERVQGIDMLNLSTDILANENSHAKCVLNRSRSEIREIMTERHVSFVEAKFDNKLNALAHTSHVMLITQLHRCREVDRLIGLCTALTRMQYTYWIEEGTGHLHLRHKSHHKYGAIIV
ncbi:hypothetical protein FDI21_gp127 [Pseudomonas phage Noxifer]|uniref:Uncharacterized protein n=1 Tax=Pseudomonas phage Noxifer TaxID=2006684 RepID=A0A1Y0T035_9CAUD|nr:hypothetical protein FDI21_gp127 [Pseudomonas phage Noxifer]ARV77296.1 hypothetical protein NOXIFER_127 [Pseudomonas phage Noxifer]